ncbi:Holliday junction resolvase RecU [Dellaglioa algida]|uniref:Holliday junction resolvase RecU n=1 Tax=Dellaglioa algida TaxID=105612 RepID=UPI0024C4E4B8|nr:Holliday junction resolvase RecU [Dellaglioa algida]MDK1727510.1 Holliday junction resolvase RecU [Dellaglioa algida]MDK1735364.1 Holliday junction resolvase RecU [Dellaglioa algida]MDK1736833.1 Holliday junction resolvase RecU [Dellaglioa algida]
MSINYPNGKIYEQSPLNTPKKSNLLLFGKRGMSLEDDINASNTFYLANNVAVIHKKPTPIKIVKVDYPKRSAAVIKEAYFQTASTTDYNGIYNGHYLDFEAKETKNKTSFPLSNFHEHQIEHMKACVLQKGISFVIIKFATLDKLYLLPSKTLFTYWDQQNKDGRKSIPLKTIQTEGFELQYTLNPVIPYLKYVDKMIEHL